MQPPRFNGRRLAAVVGVAATGATAAPVDAALVHMDVSADIPPEYFVDLGGDAANEFRIGPTLNADGVKADTFAPTTGIIVDGAAANLALGTLIDSSDTFQTFADDGLTNLSGAQGNFNTPGYIGVQFQLSGNTHFGYVGYEGLGTNTGRVFALGWEDEPGAGVLAGGIPEPTSLTLLAAGAAGLSAYRRRKSAWITRILSLSWSTRARLRWAQ